MFVLAERQRRVRHRRSSAVLRASLQLAGSTRRVQLVHSSIGAELPPEVPLAVLVISSAGNRRASANPPGLFSSERGVTLRFRIRKVQRRWSETAAAEMSGGSCENTVRRWSMPWDCRHVTEWPRQDARSRLRVPQHDRSRSTTPDSVWKTSVMTSQDGLREAIQLLSCKPGSEAVFRRRIVVSTKICHTSVCREEGSEG